MRPTPEHLAIVYDSVEEAIFLMEVEDAGLRIVSANAAFYRAMRLTAADVVGKLTTELPGADRIPGAAARFAARCLGVVEAREPVRYEHHTEYGGRRMSALLSLIPIFEEGKLPLVLSVSRDITKETLVVESLEATLRSIGEAVIATDTDGKVARMNPVAEAATGWSLDEARGRSLAAVFRVKDGVLSARDGTERAVEASTAPIKDAAGAVGGTVVVFRDVTAERRAAAEKKSAEQERAMLSALVEASRDFVGMATLDQRILYINPAGRALVGIDSLDDARRMDSTDLVPSDRSVPRAEGKPLVERGDHWVSESWLKHAKSGEIIPVEVSTFVVRDPAGLEPLALATIRRDIRERKRTEQALRESEARYRVQFEHAPEAIVTLDVDSGRFVEANGHALRLFGSPREELLRVGPLEVSPARQPNGRWSWEAAAEYIARAVDGEKPVFEWTHIASDGREIPCEVRLVRLPGAGMLCRASVIDITERKQAEELKRLSAALLEQNRLIQAANRLKSEFVANMSHELRTPLNAILGFAELLHDGKVGEVTGEQKGCLADVLASGRHLLSLINGMLDLAKVESGHLELSPERVDLASLVGEVADVLRALAARKRIHLDTWVDPSLTDIVVDPGRLKQVLFNYLSNALKFTAEDGTVSVRAVAEDGGHFKVEVEDSGVGIHDDDIGKLFIEFSQLDPGMAKHHEGTGLGLVLTKRIVEAQGGRVGVKSAFGRGSTFSAVLPRRTRAEPALHPRAQPRSASHA